MNLFGGGPVRRRGDHFVLALADDEAALLRRLASELRALLTVGSDQPEAEALMARLFPVAHPDDPELEAEYQRLMRDELVASKLGALDVIERAVGRTSEDDELGGDVDARPARLDEVELNSVMQAINSVRLILGTMLQVSDDPDGDEVAPGWEQSPEYALYGYLSWLLEHCVRALSA